MYKNVVLVGVSTEGDDFNMALRVEPLTANSDNNNNINWEDCNNLQYGNLLCISTTGDFQNLIWATVSSRDLLPKRSVVL